MRFFSTVALENPSRMLNRRIYETVGIRYDDAGVMADIVADTEAMLRQHEGIDTNRTLIVNFVSFGGVLARLLHLHLYAHDRLGHLPCREARRDAAHTRALSRPIRPR